MNISQLKLRSEKFDDDDNNNNNNNNNLVVVVVVVMRKAPAITELEILCNVDMLSKPLHSLKLLHLHCL